MYFFYIDESGEKNPLVKKEEPFVYIALALHEYQWKKFEKLINDYKLKLIRKIFERENVTLELADAEIHSSDIRIPKSRAKHPFLKYLTDEEIEALLKTVYSQLEERHFTIFAAVIDKNCLNDYMDWEKVTKKAYELILERSERFLADEHNNQQAIFVLDNTSKQLNRSVAMKHSFFQRKGTTSGVKLHHIVEIPFFVESYLSNGVQLADLCSYNIYRAFKDMNVDYEYFKFILPYIHCGKKTREEKIDGLKVFPDNHRWKDFLEEVEKKRARLIKERAQI